MEGDDEPLPAPTPQATLNVPSSRMTSRQAALATGLEAGHIELPTFKNKKVLTPAEREKRRQESAKKRKTLSDKRMEDNKTETINRLLKKQSASTRRKKAAEEGQEGAGTNGARSARPGAPAVPSFRWISTSRRPAAPLIQVIGEGDEAQTTEGKGKSSVDGPVLSFSFSIPPEFLPPVPKPPSPTPEPSPDEEEEAEEEGEGEGEGEPLTEASTPAATSLSYEVSQDVSQAPTPMEGVISAA
ncbi:hypothetical protein DL93DRAFT_586647 [Clavulina sp. PMI_390]|nr:hypothetical protein DL93DRAFT_586647 [Clavulina sp. PMI_390]